MSTPTLLIVGNDRISRLALEELGQMSGVTVGVDRSTGVPRVIRLIRRGRLSVSLVIRMALCESRRRSVPIALAYDVVSSNQDLVHLIGKVAPSKVILFRAGLIINDAVLASGVPIMNIHCAKIPEYGGIGSIERALKDRAYSQCATLHRVTSRIDEGEVHATEPFLMDPAEGYCRNEDRAYQAGIRLLKRVLV